MALGVLAVGVLAMSACVAPMPPPPPADGGPIPPGATFRSIPFTPQDASQLLSNLRTRIDTPEFAEQFDPSVRAQTLATLRSQIDRPDALQKLTELIAAENEAAARQNATGRLPAPPTADRLQAIGFTQPPSPPAPPVTPTTVPKVETQRLQPEIGAASQFSDNVPSDLKQYPIVPLGGSGWPSAPLQGQPVGSQFPWQVTGGPLAQELRDALLGGNGNLTPGASCSNLNTGARTLPTPAIPAFEGRIFTPTQGAIGRVAGGAPYHGELITRLDPQTGKRQFKVEAHLVSPLLFDAATGATFDAAAFRGHVVVEQVSAAPRSYFPGSPNTQWRTLCYAEDRGQTRPARAYVEAWIPFEGFYEPGFQVRFETVDNFWAGSNPTVFYAADQATVLLQDALPPLAPDAVAPNGSLALRVDDGVVVDRDGNLTNDVESVLKSQLLPLLEPALEGLQGDWFGIPLALYAYLFGVELSGPSLDLDIRPIAGDDEYDLTAQFGIGRLELDTLFGIGPLFCGVSADVVGGVTFRGRVNRVPGDPTSLTVSTVSLGSDLRVTNKIPWALEPFQFLACLAIAEGAETLVDDLAEGMIDQEVAPLTGTIGDEIDLEVDDVAGPGITTPAGGGFGIDLAEFDRTCEARGCQGGDVLLDEDGIALGADLRVRDGVAPTAARRFPYTFNPTLPDNLTGRFMDVRTQSGARYDAAVTLNPTFLNQILRALAEGGSTPGTGILDTDGSSGGTGFIVDAEVAPIVVTQELFPDQPPLTIFVPDLRISDGTSTFAVNAVVGVGLEIDSASRRLRPRLAVGVDVDTLSCPFGRDGATALLSYAVCANKDWNLGSGPTLPSIPDLANYVVNSLVNPLLRDSIGEIEIPTVSGFDFVALGDTKVESRNGFPTLYVGVKNGGLRIVPSGTAANLTVLAPVNGLPGTGPITWDFRVRDLNSAAVVDPPPSGSGLLSAPTSGFTEVAPFLFGLGTRSVQITVTASRGGTTFTAEQTYKWLG